MLKCIIFLVAIIVSFSNEKHSKLKIRMKHKTFSRDCKSAADNLLKYMDPAINPCDDFYQFVCGKFLNKTKIPDDQGAVGPMYDFIATVTDKLTRVIEEPPRWKKTKAFILLRRLYKTCMDKKQIEKHGTTIFKKILKFLGGWPILQGNKFNQERFDWTVIMYKLRELGYPTDSLITVDVKEDDKNSTRRVIMLSQASLGLEKGYFDLGTDDKNVRFYYESMVKAAKALGARGAFAVDLKNLLEFEWALANISLPLEDRRNATANYNPLTLAELQKKHPSVQWSKYITNILHIPGIKVGHNKIVIIESPQYIMELENLLQRTSKRILANYIIWRVVYFSLPYLPERLSNVKLRLRMAKEGTSGKQPWSTECTKDISNIMPIAMGSFYVRKFFSRSNIKPVRKMVSNLLSGFRNVLYYKTRWMDETTKGNAFKKLDKIAVYVGYAKEILDDRKLKKYYSNLQLNSNNYLLQILNVSKFNIDKTFGLLRQPVKRAEWTTRMSPSAVNAYYEQYDNSINILAAIMQAPVFSKDRPHYINYGVMGQSIGHEITHGFDQSGGQFDKNGNLVNWWTPSTKQAFQEKVQCIVKQYDKFTIPELGNMHLKGRATADENIADHGGLLAAYEAYNLWAKYKDTRPCPNYTLKQMFWISYANVLCAKYRSSSLKGMILNNEHSPGEFRVLGPLRNLEEFSKDFNCPLGSKMNPIRKCRLF